VGWSVVVPARDRPTTLNAVGHLLAQRLDEPLEVLVVDHGGTDRLVERLPVDPRLRLLRLEGRHFRRALAVNVGLRAARGAAVAVCDADCLVPPDYLAQLREVLGNGGRQQQPGFRQRRRPSGPGVGGLRPGRHRSARGRSQWHVGRGRCGDSVVRDGGRSGARHARGARPSG